MSCATPSMKAAPPDLWISWAISMKDDGWRALPHKRTQPDRYVCKNFLAREFNSGNDLVQNMS